MEKIGSSREDTQTMRSSWMSLLIIFIDPSTGSHPVPGMNAQGRFEAPLLMEVKYCRRKKRTQMFAKPPGPRLHQYRRSLIAVLFQ